MASISWQHKVLIFSPIVVIAFGQIAIRLFALIWGDWSWLPFWIVYILILGYFIWLDGGINQIKKWLAPTKTHRLWAVSACIIPVAMTLPIFIPNWKLLLSPSIWLSTLLFVTVNPFMEEFYWRGIVLDVTKPWSRWLGITYSVFFFALHHLWIGVISPAGRHPSALAGPVLMGTVWALTYKASGNLRLPIIGHILANLFSLSVPVFLNLWVPPGA